MEFIDRIDSLTSLPLVVVSAKLVAHYTGLIDTSAYRLNLTWAIFGVVVAVTLLYTLLSTNDDGNDNQSKGADAGAKSIGTTEDGTLTD